MTTTGQRRRPPAPVSSSGSVWGLLALFAFVLAFALFLWRINDPLSPAIGAFVMLPIVLGACAWMIGRVQERDFDVRGIMYLGLATRLIGTFVRFMYPADAAIYHQQGVRLAASFRSLDFVVDTQRQVPGTGVVRYISGLVHVVTFDDMAAAFVFWLLFSFAGTWFLYRAFQIGLPNGDRYRYALLLFLWPSLQYWPSSIGKEGWMLLGIGLASYGGAIAFKQSVHKGLPTIVLGLVVCGLVRPHVGLIIVIGLATAFVMRRTVSSKPAVGAKILVLALLIVGGAVLAGATATLLKADDPLGGDQITSALDSTSARTTQGDSAFTPATVHNPLEYPRAFVTVLFRPFPMEARDPQGLMTSAETVFLFVLFAASAKRLARLPTLLRTEPYVTYALVYTLVFAFAFSSIGNFGILARQRSQLTGVLLVLVCLPAAKEKLPRFGRRRRIAMSESRRANRVGAGDQPVARATTA